MHTYDTVEPKTDTMPTYDTVERPSGAIQPMYDSSGAVLPLSVYDPSPASTLNGNVMIGQVTYDTAPARLSTGDIIYQSDDLNPAAGAAAQMPLYATVRSKKPGNTDKRDGKAATVAGVSARTRKEVRCTCVLAKPRLQSLGVWF